jgi:hypothetical protein
MAGPSLGEISANGGEIPGGYLFLNPFAHPGLSQTLNAPHVETTAIDQRHE